VKQNNVDLKASEKGSDISGKNYSSSDEEKNRDFDQAEKYVHGGEIFRQELSMKYRHSTGDMEATKGQLGKYFYVLLCLSKAGLYVFLCIYEISMKYRHSTGDMEATKGQIGKIFLNIFVIFMSFYVYLRLVCRFFYVYIY
jgi:hypothetical protein